MIKWKANDPERKIFEKVVKDFQDLMIKKDSEKKEVLNGTFAG